MLIVWNCQWTCIVEVNRFNTPWYPPRTFLSNRSYLPLTPHSSSSRVSYQYPLRYLANKYYANPVYFRGVHRSENSPERRKTLSPKDSANDAPQHSAERNLGCRPRRGETETNRTDRMSSDFAGYSPPKWSIGQVRFSVLMQACVHPFFETPAPTPDRRCTQTGR